VSQENLDLGIFWDFWGDGADSAQKVDTLAGRRVSSTPGKRLAKARRASHSASLGEVMTTLRYPSISPFLSQLKRFTVPGPWLTPFPGLIQKEFCQQAADFSFSFSYYVLYFFVSAGGFQASCGAGLPGFIHNAAGLSVCK
jgi:hypothetical protein